MFGGKKEETVPDRPAVPGPFSFPAVDFLAPYTTRLRAASNGSGASYPGG